MTVLLPVPTATVFTAASLAACTMVASAQSAYFLGLGDLPGAHFNSGACDISPDGFTVVGASASYGGGAFGNNQAFRWTQEDGMIGIGELLGGVENSEANGISPDGRFVVGGSNSESGFEAFVWCESTGMIGLGDLPGGDFWSAAYDVSSGGRVVVGASKSNAFNFSEAFRWTADGTLR